MKPSLLLILTFTVFSPRLALSQETENKTISVDVTPPKEFQRPNAEMTFNSTAVVAETPEEIANAMEFLKKSFEDAEKKNPNLHASIEAPKDGSQNQAVEEFASWLNNRKTILLSDYDLPVSLRSQLFARRIIVEEPKPEFENKRTTFLKGYELPMSLREDIYARFPKYRLTMSLVRTIVNGAVAAWSVQFSNLDARTATFSNLMTFGTVFGAISGAIMAANPYVQKKWLLKPTVVSKLVTIAALDSGLTNYKWVTPKRVAAVAKWGDVLTRWGLLEAAFLMSVKLLGYGLGFNEFINARMLMEVNMTVAASVWAQGTLDGGVTVETDNALEKATKEETNPAALENRKAKIQFYSDLATLAISAFSVTFAVLDLNKVPIGKKGLFWMGVAGVINIARVTQYENLVAYLKSRKFSAKFRNRHTSAPICSAIFAGP